MASKKFLGADIHAYYDAWPLGDDWYVEGGEVELESENGEWLLDDAEKYPVGELPGIFLQAGDVKGKYSQADHEYGRYFGTELGKWLRARASTTFVVSVPNGAVEAFLAVMKASGYSVSK